VMFSLLAHARALNVLVIFCSNVIVYSSRLHTFSKCSLHNFSYLTGLDVCLLIADTSLPTKLLILQLLLGIKHNVYRYHTAKSQMLYFLLVV
jgi:hypothetical protein